MLMYFLSCPSESFAPRSKLEEKKVEEQAAENDCYQPVSEQQGKV